MGAASFESIPFRGYEKLEIFKLHKACKKTEQQREKEREEERVEPPKAIVIDTDGPEGKVIRDERVAGKVVKREVLEEDVELS